MINEPELGDVVQFENYPNRSEDEGFPFDSPRPAKKNNAGKHYRKNQVIYAHAYNAKGIVCSLLPTGTISGMGSFPICKQFMSYPEPIDNAMKQRYNIIR